MRMPSENQLEDIVNQFLHFNQRSGGLVESVSKKSVTRFSIASFYGDFKSPFPKGKRDL